MLQKVGEKLLNGIDRVREKPEPTRWAIASTITLISGAILVSILVATLPNRFSSLSGSSNSAETESGASFVGLFDSIKKSVSAIKSGDMEAVSQVEFQPEPISEEPGRIAAFFQRVKVVIALNVGMISASIRSITE